jgi:hypothetical protein
MYYLMGCPLFIPHETGLAAFKGKSLHFAGKRRFVNNFY